jgi:transposase
LAAAVQGHRMADHHRQMILLSLRHLAFLEEQLEQIDQESRQKVQQAGYEPAYALLRSIPGVQNVTALGILAEIGPTVEAFPTSKHLASWAGVSPANRKSAGKNKSGRSVGGDKWLRTLLVEVSWAAAHCKEGRLPTRFRALMPRLGAKKALLALRDAIKGSHFRRAEWEPMVHWNGHEDTPALIAGRGIGNPSHEFIHC